METVGLTEPWRGDDDVVCVGGNISIIVGGRSRNDGARKRAAQGPTWCFVLAGPIGGEYLGTNSLASARRVVLIIVFVFLLLCLFFF